jgi:hypothetical protein
LSTTGIDLPGLFDLPSMTRLHDMRLSSVIRVARFSGDGRRLLLLTADQQLPRPRHQSAQRGGIPGGCHRWSLTSLAAAPRVFDS